MGISLLTKEAARGGCLYSTWRRQLLAGLFIVIASILPANNAFAQVIINEVMFDVPSGSAGDANGDGTRSARGDEFVELVNTGPSAIDISGWTISQRAGDTVFTFPNNVTLQPGEFTVVFGGIGSSGFGSQFPPELQLFASQSGANNGFAGGGRTNFSNSGDNVVLRDAQGIAIAELYWGSASARTSVGQQLAAPNTINGVSISGSIRESVTREPDKTGLWAAHNTVGNAADFTPGAFNTGEFAPPPTGNQRTLSISATGMGSVVLDPPGGVYNDGTFVTLTANPDSGWSFDSWSGDVTGSTNPTGITMDANKSVTAAFFEPSAIPPTAQANGPYAGTVNVAVSFSSAGSDDPDGVIETYLWDFGDGQTSAEANPSHTYTAAGNYTVTLTVTDNSGLTDSDTASADIAAGSALVELTYDNFETGFGNYTDGGSDASLYTGGTRAHQGNNAANIQDNSGSASSFFHTNGIDATPYASLEIEFWFFANSMENGEDFFVEVFDGSNWQIVAQFIRGTDFENGSFFFEKVTVNQSDVNFATDMKVRFRNDASGNNDDVYIDEVRVSGVPLVTYALTASTTGQGSITLDPDGGIYPSGTVVSVTATPAIGWEFDRWQGALSGSINPNAIQMDDNRTVTAVFVELPPDNTPPSPDPMQWSFLPNATSNTSITMTATTAFDVSGVEYFFEETSGNPGGSDSGWQDSPSYTDDGLDASTQYTYRVRARDKSLNMNLTGWTPLQSATTLNTPVGIDQEGPMMALAGQITFTATPSGSGPVSWSVDRLTRSESSGGNFSRQSNVFSASGLSATFNLTKVSGDETVYEISASDSGFSETISVQVFPPNVRTSFFYESAGNPDVRVYMVVPASVSSNSSLISVHHGTSRNADDYILNWDDWGPANDTIAIAPRFDSTNWPGSRSYNLGNMFTGNDGSGDLNPEDRWSFTIARDIALKVMAEFGLNDTEYDAWGHSAGGQFVHRMMIFRPDAPIRWAIPANPGWWTEPSLQVDYPYGLGHPLLSYTQQDILDWTNKPMIIFRGENDTGSSGLRTTPEANAQGANRFERAQYMFDRGLEVNPNNLWELNTVLGCGHDRNCMAPPAQDYIDAQP